MTGIEDFTAIINPPQAAILAVGKTLLQPWVNDQGTIIAQHRMTLTLSCDHRVIDGIRRQVYGNSCELFRDSHLNV